MKKITGFLLAASLLSSAPLFADKTGVTISALSTAARGSQVTITLRVTHKGNNIFHYTNYVYLKINGKEVKRWKFKAFGKPEAANFTRTFTLTATEDMKLEAFGNCNLHGGHGPVYHEIKLK